MPKQFIGLTGLRGSGKTTAARMVVDTLNSNWYGKGMLAEVRSFATAVREELYQTFKQVEITGSAVWPDGFQPRGVRVPKFNTEYGLKLWEKPTPSWARKLLQQYGKWRREQDPDYWVKAADLDDSGHGWVIFDDVRFPNEAKAIREKNGLIFRLVRDPEVCDIASGGAPEDRKDESEHGLPPELIDADIDSNGKIASVVGTILYILLDLPEKHLRMMKLSPNSPPLFKGEF